MKKQIIGALLLALLIISSCKKGDTGAQGPQGPQGEQGLQGIAGIKGADGSMVLSGTVVPAATLGKLGDYYFRTNTYILYGPKTAAGWGAGVNLKGANGTNGAAGSKILSGTAIPAANLGAVGDFYFKTDTYQFFGPKVASGWGAGVNLKGTTGTANVIYSGWQSAVRFKDSIMDGTSLRIAHIYAPRLTTSVISNSAIMMYIDYGGGLFPLPYTSNAAGRMSTIAFKTKLSEFVVYRYVYDGGALVILGGNIQYRYVIIPGGVKAKLKEKNIDIKDPVAVQKYLDENPQE